jgi:3-hydroxyisobutyrate dehydrogenase
MGYHMAVNLRNKIGSDRTMLVVDVNEKACERYLSETANAGPSRIVKNAREALLEAVSLIWRCRRVFTSSDTPRIP